MGTSKIYGPCPRCKASYLLYRHVGRFKHCFQCGYDRFSEIILAQHRHNIKVGRSSSDFDKRVEYLANKYLAQLRPIPKKEKKTL